jgi:hypothetical protein
MNNNTGSINKSFRQPNSSAVLSHGMAEYLRPLESGSKIFSEIREATNGLVARTLDKYKVHIWKSLPSTSGGNFEAFSVGGFSPYLPIDTNWKGWPGGSIYFGVENNNKPPSKSNPPDSKTQALLLDGGDFYTVNVMFPNSPKFWKNHQNGKGESFGQADYVRIIPPKKGNIYKVKIIEFKNGLTHLEMAIQEEGQLNRIADTIKMWYEALPLRTKPDVQVELYYCPAAATNASFYAGTHTSETVNFITTGALAKILQVNPGTIQKYATIRSTQNQIITNRLENIKRRTSSYLATISNNKLNALRRLTPKNLGISHAAYTTGYNFSGRKIKIIILMIVRKALLLEYNSTTNANKKRNIKLKLIDVTSQILSADKVANNSETILEPATRLALKNFLTKLGGQTNRTTDTSFEQFVHYRKEYVNSLKLPEWPAEFTSQEIVRRATFSKINQEYKKLIESANRITNSAKLQQEIQAIQTRTRNGMGINRVPTSAAFRSYYSQRMTNLGLKLKKLRENEGTNEGPARTRRAISGVPEFNRNTMNKAVINSVINSSNFASAYTNFIKYHTNLEPALNAKLLGLSTGNIKTNNKGNTVNNNARNEYAGRYRTKENINAGRPRN